MGAGSGIGVLTGADSGRCGGSSEAGCEGRFLGAGLGFAFDFFDFLFAGVGEGVGVFSCEAADPLESAFCCDCTKALRFSSSVRAEACGGVGSKATQKSRAATRKRGVNTRRDVNRRCSASKQRADYFAAPERPAQVLLALACGRYVKMRYGISRVFASGLGALARGIFFDG